MKDTKWEIFDIQEFWEEVRVAMDEAFNRLKAMGIEKANYLSLPGRMTFTSEKGPFEPLMSIEVPGLDFPWKNDDIEFDAVNLNKRIVEFHLSMPYTILTTDIGFDDVLKLDIPNAVRKLIAKNITEAVDKHVQFYADESPAKQQWRREEPRVQRALNTSAKIYKYIADNP